MDGHLAIGFGIWPFEYVVSCHQTIAHCHKPLNLELVVSDSENRRFDNISSLGVTWSISEPSLINSPPQDQPSFTQVTSLHGFTIPIRSKCLCTWQIVTCLPYVEVKKVLTEYDDTDELQLLSYISLVLPHASHHPNSFYFIYTHTQHIQLSFPAWGVVSQLFMFVSFHPSHTRHCLLAYIQKNLLNS